MIFQLCFSRHCANGIAAMFEPGYHIRHAEYNGCLALALFDAKDTLLAHLSLMQATLISHNGSFHAL